VAATPSGNVVGTLETTTTTTYTNLATAGPAVTVNVSPTGMALVILTSQLMNGIEGGGCAMGFAVSGPGPTSSPAADTQALVYVNNVGNHFEARLKQVSAVYLVTGLGAGSNILTAQYRAVDEGTCSFANRGLIAIPY
jgi:hypothetical protein